MMNDLLPGIPLIENPFFNDFFPRDDGDLYAIAEKLHESGYAVIDFPDDEFEARVSRIRRNLEPRFDIASWKRRKGPNLRLQDAWRYDEDVKAIACNSRLLDLLTRLWGRPAVPFQTLDFPVGTEQSMHADYVHFSSVPERFMVGVWVALEDIDTANGPLFYYPGSHRFPSYGNEHLGINKLGNLDIYSDYGKYERLWQSLVERYRLDREYGLIKKGQAILWTANLIHGGAEHIDRNRTRWSQVTHYFFENCAYTTPLANDIYHGQFYFRRITDIATGRPLSNTVGIPIAERVVDLFTPAPARENYSRYSGNLGQSSFRNHRNIPKDFDPGAYLRLNSDLYWACVDPYQHYALHGCAEGRDYRGTQ